VAFPTAQLFQGVEHWSVEHFGNESISFHSWLMNSEISPYFVLFSSSCLRIAPTLIEAGLRRMDRPPFYRMIFALRRRGQQSV
jgi:hypothetical protein